MLRHWKTCHRDFGREWGAHKAHPKDGAGRTRLLGSSACEDKLVQDAVRAVLEAIDAQDLQE
jgi:hypothetical protein